MTVRNRHRWEAEDTILPFLRTREFLWHEGHAAHATSLEAQIEVEQTIAFYEEFYENQLAVPVIKGRKTLKEKFAAAEFSNTVEIYIPASGRGIQAATAHYIGENYARVYAICYEDKDSTTRHYVYQSSWGMTTRCIGILAMIHGDDKGLVLPPKVSPIQVVIIPRFASLTEQEKNDFQTVCSRVQNELVEAGVRVLTDRRHRYSAEQKILHWVVKGVPVIMDVKPEKEHEGHVFITKRHSGERTILESDKLTAAVLQMLEEIQAALYTKAKADLQDNVVTCETFTELCEALDKKKLILAPFCAQPACEENIRRHSERAPKPEDGTLSTGARALCIPFNQPGEVTEDMTCVYPGCKRNPESYCLFGKCY